MIKRKCNHILLLSFALFVACADPVVTIPGEVNDQGMSMDMQPDLDQDVSLDMADMVAQDMPQNLDMMADQTEDMSVDFGSDANMDLDMHTKDMSVDPDEMHIGTPCAVGQVMGTCQRITTCQQAGKTATPGLCPGSSQIQCCTTPQTNPSTCDPNQMPTPNDGLTEAPGTGGCPAGMIRVSTFCIDQYEASLIEVKNDGSTQSWSPYFNPGTRTMRAVSLKNAVPQGYITGLQAEAACQQAGKRLCTSQEWLRACQGAQPTVYPYGDTRQPGLCNDARATHPAIEYFGANDPNVWSKLGHQCINQQANTLTKTGSKTQCVTTDGAFDMMGNLHEWTSDSSGIFRGGFYADTFRNGNGCLYRTTAHNRQHWDYSTGFRCCHD